MECVSNKYSCQLGLQHNLVNALVICTGGVGSPGRHIVQACFIINCLHISFDRFSFDTNYQRMTRRGYQQSEALISLFILTS